ncbi:hypothetical protein [Lutispora sp.]|uniref:hypothetical protein n=1 Tax=Lutispora sp. TaxID=2828727 RepID=UPI0035675FDF
MTEIHINKDDIKSIVESYTRENSTFVIKSFIDNDSQKKCQCFINGKECKIIFYIKKNSVRILPVGKNIDESNLLIGFIKSKGFSTDVAVNQFVFPCTKTVIDELVEYVKDECNGIVTCSQNGNLYKFIGYNGDVLTFTFYPQTNKAMIQGKPFHAYSIVLSYLSGLPEFSFDQIVDINNAFAEMNTPSDSIRNEMQSKLGKAYLYLDEALLKSISGSLTLLKQKSSSEDYTGCVTGEFKALEGYLKKILSQKYNYRLEKKNTFNMFHRDKGTPSKIDLDVRIHEDEKKELNKLYAMYSNKRNVYLHSTVDPSQTRIIETLKEAQDLSDEILQTINDSYQIIFK